MHNIQEYLKALLAKNDCSITSNKENLIASFVSEEQNIQMVKEIYKIQENIMAKWKLTARVNEIIDKQIRIPNGTVNKEYEVKIDLNSFDLNDVIYIDFQGIQEYGLSYDQEFGLIKGNPTAAGDFKIKLRFRLNTEDENSELHEKIISLVINSDPKSLWKNLPSVQEQDNYWKPDNATIFQPLGSKTIAIASKRGRSHANVGGFREDDFSIKHFENTDWSLVCLADGAGSAKLSREGSRIACSSVVDYFSEHFTVALSQEFDENIKSLYQEDNENLTKKVSHFVYNNLSKAAIAAHRNIENFANKLDLSIKDFHTTLIFTLFKKYDFGYAVLSFSVGDCPIALLHKDLSAVKLMNWLDVGEFSGGTRFITMPEVFTSDKFPSRFSFKLIDDFSYLMLMTDGIYDPKFVVEANLEKTENWIKLLDDLKGNNDEKIKVNLSKDNTSITTELSDWMDFWSPGNHDDRTLAIIF